MCSNAQAVGVNSQSGGFSIPRTSRRLGTCFGMQRDVGVKTVGQRQVNVVQLKKLEHLSQNPITCLGQSRQASLEREKER